MNLIHLLEQLCTLSEKAAPAPWKASTVDDVGGGTLYDKTVAIASFHWDNECDRAAIDGIHRFRTIEECDSNSALVEQLRNTFTPACLRIIINIIKGMSGADIAEVARRAADAEISQYHNEHASPSTRGSHVQQALELELLQKEVAANALRADIAKANIIMRKCVEELNLIIRVYSNTESENKEDKLPDIHDIALRTIAMLESGGAVNGRTDAT